MKKNYIISLLITFVIFVLLLWFVFILCALLNISGGAGDPSGYWDMLLAATTTLMAAGVFGAAYLASRQLTEVCDSRHLDAANAIFTILNSKENIDARRSIYKNIPEQPADAKKAVRGLSPDVKDDVKLVLNSLDQVAFLTQENWIPESKMMPWMHPIIAKTWKRLAWLVEYDKEARNEPYYYENVCRLAENCRRWRQNHGIDDDTRWLDARDTI